MAVSEKELNENKILKRARFPEEAGFSTQEISELIDDLKSSGIEAHSLMLIRDGRVAFESFAAPYGPEYTHMVYSVSKSFTAMAVGFAVNEGILSLNTTFLDVFPEYLHLSDSNLGELTVHHLLSMQSGKNVSAMGNKARNTWFEDFVHSPWGFEPGKGWQYVSENQYVLCCIIRKLTGQTVTEYLTPRLYEPLGIDVPFWEHDKNGTEAGGWGLFLKTEDIAKFCACLLNDGKLFGKQIIPKEWVAECRKIQGSNAPFNEAADSASGYGYCFWRCSAFNGFRCDGMFSQFGYMSTDYNAALIITAGEISEQKTRDCLNRHFPKCIVPKSRKKSSAVLPALAPLDDDLDASEHPETERKIEGRVIKFRKNILLDRIGYPVSILPFPVTYMSGERAGNITDVVFNFRGSECTFSWREKNERNSVVCGMNGEAVKSRITLAGMNFTVFATAKWTADNELMLHMRPVEAVCRRNLVFTFDGKNVTFKPSTTQPLKAMCDNIARDMDKLLPNVAPVQAAGYAVFDKLPDVAECRYYGKIREK